MTEENTSANAEPSAPAAEETSVAPINSQEGEISPIDEAKKVLEENKKLLAEMKDERKRIEKATAEMLMNGKSYGGQAKVLQIPEAERLKNEKVKAFGMATGASWAKRL